jgi:branched-chain amino acid transport system substrate-binding protein
MAIINEDTLFSKAAASGTIELAKKKGIQVVYHEAYPKGTTDFSAMLTKIKSLNPDVIAAGSYFDDAVATARQMKELDVNPRMFGVTVGGDLPEFYKLLGKTAEFVYGSSQWEKTLPYPAIKEFVGNYEALWKREPNYHAAAAYGACQIYAQAIRNASSLDSDRLREQLLKIKTTTDFGDYEVDQRGFQTAHKMVLHQWQNGQKVVVWPAKVSDGKPLFPTPPWNQR